MNHRFGSIAFGMVVGLLIAVFSYRWITDPGNSAERAEEERVVLASRILLSDKLAPSQIEIVDPLAPRRRVGKVYVSPQQGGWAVSGYYSRTESERWYPYLMSLNADLTLSKLKVQDSDTELIPRAAADPTIEVSR